MSGTYTPGPEADAIVERLLARGTYSGSDDIVRAALQLLWRHEVELAELLRLGQERIAGRGAHSGQAELRDAADRIVPGGGQSSRHRPRGARSLR